jgi:GT2 family glycosyltransferase
MKLLVVIVNYRVPQLTIDCLHSVAGEIVPGIKVAVRENGTGDDSAERIQRAIDDNGWGGWCTLDAGTCNLGFTGGNNVLLRPAMDQPDPPEYFLLLNPDTVVRPGAFQAMMDFLDAHPVVGIVGCRLEQPDGLTQCSAFRFQSPASEFEGTIRLGLVTRLLQKWMVAPPPRNETFQTDWVSGAGMMIRREVIRDTGFLDEGLFTYFDDCDFCFNARKKGWPTWYVPTGTVLHLKGQSSGVKRVKPNRLPAYYFQARRRYFLKNYGPWYTALADAAQILGQALWRLRVLCTGIEDRSAPHLLGDAIRHSVFATGFKLQVVPHPALTAKTKQG